MSTKKKPHASVRVVSDAIASMGALYGKGEATRPRTGWQSPRLPANWREQINPGAYYGRHIERLGKPDEKGRAVGRCPFHDDASENLSVHVMGVRGGWKCHAGCGQGDAVSFAMRLRGLRFADAVRELLGVRA